MIIFIAFYFYFLIQLIMATKWNDSSILKINELKDKLSWVPSMVEKWTKNVKKKISDESVVVIEKVKDITEKAWKTIKEWKDYVVDKCKNLKTKINDIQVKSCKKDIQKNDEVDQNSISELIEMNKQLIELTKKLIDKYEENTKLINEISKKLLPTKSKTKVEKSKK